MPLTPYMSLLGDTFYKTFWRLPCCNRHAETWYIGRVGRKTAWWGIHTTVMIF